MAYLKQVGQLFQAWFLPTPAHDDPRVLRRAAEAEAAAASAVAAVPLAAQDTTDTTDLTDGRADEANPPGDMPDDIGDATVVPDETGYDVQSDPSVDPARIHPTGPAPLNPVAPPEAADERQSRSPSAQNPFTAE